MHVDGGASSHVFFYSIGFDWSEVIERMEVEGKPNLYVIRNGFLKVDWKPVRCSSLAIARRTIRTLMTNALLGDMYRIYLAAQRDGINYHLA
jgi:hypothetical protein